MTNEAAVRAHYTRGDLFEAIASALASAGRDIDAATVETLSPIDHFHGRGATATEELAAPLQIAPDHTVLDIGCGIGGPARYMADRYGCRVVGVDLTEEFCDVARRLNDLVGLAGRVTIHHGSALDLPFDAATFDAAYCHNVAMNIADKDRLYAEAHRVLRPGGKFGLAEVALGEAGQVVYPVPWAEDGAASHLQTLDQMRAGLRAAGFDILTVEDRTADSLASHAEMRARIAREGPPKLGPHIMMGDSAKTKMRNSARNVEEGRTRPFDVVCVKPAG